MKCPVCDDVRMREVEKDDVLIDVCPECKGVWLDRGELEKLMAGVREVRQDYERLERQMYEAAPYQPPAPSQPAQGYGQQQNQAYGQQGFGQPGPHYGNAPMPDYAHPPQGGPGYNQPPAGQGYGHQTHQGYPPGYGGGKYGYDKYGRPYKRKKNMLDVLGDLFD